MERLSRNFSIIQYGGDINSIKAALVKTTNIDKCDYAQHKKGTDSSHIHVGIHCQYPVEVHTIAELFGVPDNQVDVLRGKNGYDDFLKFIYTNERK